MAQRFTAANEAPPFEGDLAPEVARLTFIPPPPPAPAWSAEFASTPARARWNRTTPAKCAPRHPTRRRRWLLLPVPARAEYWRRLRLAGSAPHFPIASPPRAPPAKSAHPPKALLRGGSRLPQLRNSLPAASAL